MTASRPTPLFGEREALAFLNAAFSGLPENRYVVLWQLDGKQSVSFTDLDKAAEWAGGRNDAYVHVGVADRAYLGSHRIKATDVAGIVGCWADIDIDDPVHKKSGLPPNEAAALAVAQSTGLKPSILVHSGHGLQAWWLLNEPWMFETLEERKKGALLVRAWDLSLRERTKRLGWTLDAVGDLSRLLRIPGTRNCKALPVAVRIEQQNEVRYSVDDLEAVLIEGTWQLAERELRNERSSGTTDRPADDGDLALNPAAEPPKDRMFALCENDPRFLATWNRSRTGKDVLGWTASEYDLALARFAALASWTRQEIANLMIASRRKHGDDLKLRQDYYTLTIDRATADHEQREAVADVVAVVQETAKLATDDPDFDRGPILKRISAAIEVDLRRIIRNKGEPPIYTMDVAGKIGPIGSIEVLLSNSKFRAKVGELASLVPKRMKNEQWDPIAQALVSSAEVEDLGIESTAIGRAETLVSLYLGQNKPARWLELDVAGRGRLAFTLQPFEAADGCLRVFGSGLGTWLGQVQALPMTPNEVGLMLRTYGAKPETMNFKTDSGRTTRAVWALPADKGEPE